MSSHGSDEWPFQESDDSTDTDDLSDYEREARGRPRKKRRIDQRSQVADPAPESEARVPDAPLEDVVEMVIGDPEPSQPPDPEDFDAWPLQGERWTAEEALAQFEGLYTQWFPVDLRPEDRPIHPLRLLGFDTNKATGLEGHTNHLADCEKEFRRQRALAASISLELDRHELMKEDDTGLGIRQRMRQILSAVYSSREILRNTFRYVAEFIPEFDSSTEESLEVRWFTTMLDQVPGDLYGYQELLLFLYREVYDRGYRKSGDMCFERVFTEDGHYFTYAWREAMPIDEFVRRSTDKMINFAQWCNRMSHKDNTLAVIREMTDGIDEEFPELEMDRDVFAFENGIYIGRADRFHPYARGPASLETATGVRKEPVAAKYFPVVIPEEYFDLDCADWEVIETPHIDTIIKFQRLHEHEDVVFWFFALLGRWFFNIKDFDDWQVAPLLLGMAGTGKSTILDMIKKAYPANKVPTMSNNIEGQFGLSSLWEGFSWIAPDVKYDFAGNQADLQCIISGESVSVAVKHKTARNVIWKSPGIFGANEVPKFSDNAGSMSRRLVVIQFARLVQKQDGSLGRKLEKELPFFIMKAIKAYRHALQVHGTRGIWENLPPYFHETRGDLQETTNALVHFIRSDKLARGDTMYMPAKEFKEAFNRHCDENHFYKHRWVKDYYHGPFQMNSLCVRELRRKYPRDRGDAPLIHCQFILGCDIRTNSAAEMDPFEG